MYVQVSEHIVKVVTLMVAIFCGIPSSKTHDCNHLHDHWPQPIAYYNSIYLYYLYTSIIYIVNYSHVFFASYVADCEDIDSGA